MSLISNLSAEGIVQINMCIIMYIASMTFHFVINEFEK